MATTTFQKILGNLSTNKNVKNLITDFQKLSQELTKKGNDLNTRIATGKTAQQARAQYKKVLAIVAESQKQLDKEVGLALKMIKRSAADVEKNLKTYRKQAVAQAQKFEKTLLAKKAGLTPKTAASKTTTKTATTKKKTSKKKTSKKATA